MTPREERLAAFLRGRGWGLAWHGPPADRWFAARAVSRPRTGLVVSVHVTPDADEVVELETLGSPTVERLLGWTKDLRDALGIYHRPDRD